MIAKLRRVRAADRKRRYYRNSGTHWLNLVDSSAVPRTPAIRGGDGLIAQLTGPDRPAGGFLEVRRAITYRQRKVLIGAPKSGQARRVDVPRALVARLRERQSIGAAVPAVAGREPSPWVFPAPTDDAKLSPT